VDTTQWVAQLDNLHAQRRNLLEQKRSLLAQEKAARAQIDEAQAQSDALAAQLATATAERNRTQRLAATQAATARELSEREGLVNQLTAQVRQAEARVQTTRAQAEVFAIQASALDAQVSALDAQTRQIQDRLDNTILTNPRPGTILTVLARAGEVVRPGSQLYTIAELDPLILRAYATGNQLPRLKVGMTVDILVDDGQGGLESRQGTITFIAPDAEFTPTPIQTRDERAELVYAFEVRTPNPDGRLKIGMPGEVRFLTETQ
jgi:HlyD family secretion protein